MAPRRSARLLVSAAGRVGDAPRLRRVQGGGGARGDTSPASWRRGHCGRVKAPAGRAQAPQLSPGVRVGRWVSRYPFHRWGHRGAVIAGWFALTPPGDGPGSDGGTLTHQGWGRGKGPSARGAETHGRRCRCFLLPGRAAGCRELLQGRTSLAEAASHALVPRGLEARDRIPLGGSWPRPGWGRWGQGLRRLGLPGPG